MIGPGAASGSSQPFAAGDSATAKLTALSREMETIQLRLSTGAEVPGDIQLLQTLAHSYMNVLTHYCLARERELPAGVAHWLAHHPDCPPAQQ